jgi:hypothetical protein
MADAVRTTIASAASPPKRRTVDEQLLVRWPGLYLRLARAFERMSPRSKIRRYFLRRGVVSTWRAWSRGDLDLVLGRYAQDAELHAIPNMIATGMDRTYEGHAGIRRLAADWGEAWGEMSVAPLEVWDFGEIGFEYDVHSVVWWRRGLVVRHRDFTNREEALRAIDAESAAASP